MNKEVIAPTGKLIDEKQPNCMHVSFYAAIFLFGCPPLKR
jgi:hypothetical protein